MFKFHNKKVTSTNGLQTITLFVHN